MARLSTWALAAMGALLVAAQAWAGTSGGTGTNTNIPEPVSMALLATGIGGVAWAKFRRRK